MRYDKSLPLMREYWLSCFSSMGGNAAAPAFDTAGGQMLGHDRLLSVLRRLPIVRLVHNHKARTVLQHALQFAETDETPLPIAESGTPLPGLLRCVLGMPDPSGQNMDKLRIGSTVAALTGETIDMVGFFQALTEMTVRASEQAIGFESSASTIRQLREMYGQDLLCLTDAQFVHLLACTFTQSMVDHKQAFRRECLVAIDTRASQRFGKSTDSLFPEFAHPEIAHKMADFYRKNCSLLMGAWDAFGAALVEEAARRDIRIDRPNTRTVGNEPNERSRAILASFNTIVAEKSLGDPLRLVRKALRLLMALPAGEGAACNQVLAEMRRAADIPAGRAGNRMFDMLFSELFRQTAEKTIAEQPSLAMAMQCWCSWMRQSGPANNGIGVLDHDTSLLLKQLEAVLK